MTFAFDLSWWQLAAMVIDYAIKFVMIGVVPENRKPSSANAWLLLILLLPIIGLPLYLLMGSKIVSSRRHRIQREATNELDNIHYGEDDLPFDAELSPDVAAMVRLNRRLTGYPAVYGHVPALWSDYDMTMRRIASLIDATSSHINIEIYAVAWDNTTDIVFEALERAVARGVHVRLLFDHIGSQKYPGFRKLKRRLTAIGVDWHMMLPLDPLRGRWRRPDLRNHRKLITFDGQVAMMGSFNLIDRSYLMRSHVRAGRQWVDAFVELEGPIVASLESLFAVDWYTESNERIDLNPPARLENPTAADVHTLQLVPSGPGYLTEPNLRMFNTMIHHARESVTLCSPYFVPEDSLLEAITSACYRGVRIDLLVGERSDQFMVQHAQSAYYQNLLEAGVRIWEFPAPYVLHTKFALADVPRGAAGAGAAAASAASGSAAGEAHAASPVGLIGSSNMDIRSFSLNYESTLLIAAGPLLDQLDRLAQNYMAVSHELTLERWDQRPWYRRYVDNVMKLTSAVQ